ncbi:MAG: RusA family crossover junction endodeoxyribonuclease [Actinomycetota bacterium]
MIDVDELAELTATEPVLRWAGDIQPVALSRARVTFKGRGASAHNEEKDVQFRKDLQTLWRNARLVSEPLEDRLLVVMTFQGKSRTPLGQRLNEPDLTNLLKAVEDAGNKHLWRDDRQIKFLVGELVAWGADVEPLVMISAWSLSL